MKKNIRISFVGLLLLITMTLCACGGKAVTPDYTDVASFEAALNNGEDLTGKTVQITVDKLVPDSAFGYNIQTGEHLNFCSSSNPKVSEGDTIIVEVTEVNSMLGSFVISYKVR